MLNGGSSVNSMSSGDDSDSVYQVRKTVGMNIDEGRVLLKDLIDSRRGSHFEGGRHQPPVEIGSYHPSHHRRLSLDGYGYNRRGSYDWRSSLNHNGSAVETKLGGRRNSEMIEMQERGEQSTGLLSLLSERGGGGENGEITMMVIGDNQSLTDIEEEKTSQLSPIDEVDV